MTDLRIPTLAGCGLLIALAATSVAPSTAQAAGGCLKYGAAGAVAGHFAHRHAVLGAVAGCAVGMYKKHHERKMMQEQGRT